MYIGAGFNNWQGLNKISPMNYDWISVRIVVQQEDSNVLYNDMISTTPPTLILLHKHSAPKS